MENAGKEELQLAKEKNNVDINGVGQVTVYADGGWSKRSYGHTYNAASGVVSVRWEEHSWLEYTGRPIGDNMNRFITVYERTKVTNRRVKKKSKQTASTSKKPNREYGSFAKQAALTKTEFDSEYRRILVSLQVFFFVFVGLIADDGLIEVKCLYTLHLNNMSIEKAIAEKKCICLGRNDDGIIQLKRNHNYYYQIQGQLNICNKNYCYFVVYVNDEEPLFIERIERNRMLWKNVMVPKLQMFYKNFVLPEIINKKAKK
ncbi:exonuclease phage-type/recb c-terminal domain-containing protein [Holotrichia oblita]|uniref:Exonuclease phage-type/recb c-terminal domain-containing protein n=1 Tax=Holotrichia oblita TaxID=644536 RepID=A0ACB9SN30_HOLOL|nr:exonuclease phage-type/recb c-terminal domain-containing protein [Holotrichia oblita]